MITNDAIILGLLMVILGVVFNTSSLDHPFWKKFYSIVPSLLVVYFLPSVLTTTGLIDASQSRLYHIFSRYLLPASLVLLTLSVDLKEIWKLGPKALILFFTGTISIIIGGPMAILLFSYIAPDLVQAPPPNEVWRGMTTIAGSWIGGGANQAAMKEVFEVDNELFSRMVAVDIIIGNLWLGVLLVGAGYQKQLNGFLKGDTRYIEELKIKMDAYQSSIARIPSLPDMMKVLMVAFGFTALSHLLGDWIAPFLKTHFPILEQYSLTSSFFWIVVLATTFGVAISFTGLRRLEGVGASKMGSVFLYLLVASIGMQMNILAIRDNSGLFLVGMAWMLVHIILMSVVAKLIKAPYFFIAIGSTANVGGAASAPIIAGAFHPSLAPVGVLLAVLGYVLGTYGAYICGILMQLASP